MRHSSTTATAPKTLARGQTTRCARFTRQEYQYGSWPEGTTLPDNAAMVLALPIRMPPRTRTVVAAAALAVMR